jgi:hypothetical protein
MARFGGKRDINIFRSVNREILHDIIETFVDILSLNSNITNVNMYGESKNKTYNAPVRIPSYIDDQPPEADTTEFGKSTLQTVIFHFIRDDLKKLQLVITEGDLINWNNKYYEIDHIIQNSYFMDRNPETNKSVDSNFGWNYDITLETHLSARNKVQFIQTR